MDRYFVRLVDREQPEDCEPEDWESIRALSPDLAARTLVEQHESCNVEYPIAAGHEYATVEVKGHGRFQVDGDPGPHYVVRALPEGHNAGS